jgi:hypothetical protein
MDHRLDQGGPSQIVDVVKRRPPGDQAADNLLMSQMRRGNQRGAVIDAGHQIGPVAQAQGQRDRLGVVRNGGNGQ